MMPTKDDAPERIWADFDSQVFFIDYGRPEIGCTPYVRADMLAALQAEVERLTVERDEYKAWTDTYLQESVRAIARAEAAEAAGREKGIREAAGVVSRAAEHLRANAKGESPGFVRMVALSHVQDVLDSMSGDILALIPTPPVADAARVTVSTTRGAADELAQVVDDEIRHWPEGTPYSDHLNELQASLRSALTQPQEARDDMQDV